MSNIYLDSLYDDAEVWDGAVVIVAFDDDGTKHLICQTGIRMSADEQLHLAEDLKRNALNHYDEIEDIRNSERDELEAEWLERLNEPRPVAMRQVYLIRAGNSYKVGVSKDPQRRLREILCHQPDAELVSFSKPLPSKRAFEIEKKLHQHLAQRNLTNEWFTLRPQEANIIAKWISEGE